MTAIAAIPAAPTTSTTGGNGFPCSPEDLKSAARALFAQFDVQMSPNRLNRLVVAYVNRVQANGITFLDYLADILRLDVEQKREALADPEVARVCDWSDPTGETAVRNVMRERGY